MPNGGSDNCATCWSNRANRDQGEHAERVPRGPHYCEIRNQAIEDPGYTYCLNHQFRTPEKDPVPIGPILTAEIASGLSYVRVVWKESPDTEEIRMHLLDLLTRVETIHAADYHPVFGPKVPHYPSYAYVVIWQLGEFHESRAVSKIEWVRQNIPDLKELAQEALEKIRG